MSNIAYRSDVRTPEDFHRDRIKGTKQQIELLNEFVSRHNETYPTCPLKFLEVKHSDYKRDDGEYRDSELDAQILMQKGDDSPFWRMVEIEHVAMPGCKARFKRTKIEGCLKKQAPILHFQVGINSPMVFCFSVPILQAIHDKNAYQRSVRYYGNKPFYEFNSMFPDAGVPYVEWPSLSPKERYKDILRILNNPCK